MNRQKAASPAGRETEKRKILIPALATAASVCALAFGVFKTIGPDKDLRAAVEETTTAPVKYAVSDYPMIAVRPFENDTGEEKYDFLNANLQSILVQDLSRFRLVRPVIYDEVYETLPKTGETNRSPYKYAIKAIILSVEPELKLDIKLIDLDTGATVSEKQIRRSPETDEYFENLSEIVEKLSGDFAGAQGAIVQDNFNLIESQIARGTMSLSDLSRFECLVLTDKFQYDPKKSPAKFKAVYSCLSSHLDEDPDDPVLLANYGALLYWTTKSDPKFHELPSLNPDINPEDGLKMVRRAAKMDPEIGNVQYLLSATIVMDGGTIEEALYHAELAHEANKGDSLYMYWLSRNLADAGKWDRALSLAKEARDRTAIPPAHYYLPDYCFALLKGDKAEMQQTADTIADKGFGYSYLYEYLAAVANDDAQGMAKFQAKIDRMNAAQIKRGHGSIMYVLQWTTRNEDVLAKARELFVKAGVLDSAAN